MKNNFLIVLLGIITFFTFVNCRLNAQTLSLIDLQNLCKKQSWENVDNYLSKKGWDYHDSKKGNSEQFSTITYAFDKNYWDDKAKAWLYVYAYNNEVQKIIYICGSKTNYNSIKNSLISNGYKKVDSQIEDQMISIVYENSLFKIEIESRQNVNDDYYTHYDSYSFVIIRKNGFYDSENGPVTNYWLDGTTIMEEYTLKNGKYNGIYKFYSSDGKLKYSVNYLNGEMHGKGIFNLEDGGYKEVNFANDLKSGVAKTFDENGILRVLETYSNDKLNGKYQEFSSNGKLSFETTLKDDSINGKYTHYFEDGITISLQARKINGSKEGAFVSYYDKDNKAEEGNFVNNKKNGKWISYPKPNEEETIESLRIEEEYKDDMLNGTTIAYNKLGNIVFSQEYINDSKVGNGLIFRYDKQGNLVEKEIIPYLNNEKHGKHTCLAFVEDSTLEYQFTNYLYGKKDGLAKENYSNKVIICNYKNDKLHGKCQTYTESPYTLLDLSNIPMAFKDTSDMYLKSIYTYSNGYLDGEFVEYSNCDNVANLWQKGYYSYGKKISTWQTFRQNYFWEKSLEEIQVPGLDIKGNAMIRKTEDQELLYSQSYNNDLLNGKTICYFRPSKTSDNNQELEKCEIIANFKNGRFDGDYSSKDEDGMIESQGIFTNGYPQNFFINFKNEGISMSYDFNAISILLTVKKQSGEKAESTYSYQKSKWPIFDSLTIFSNFNYQKLETNQIPMLINLTQIKFSEAFLKESREGSYKLYDKEGNLVVEGFYMGEKKYGIWRYYHRDQNIYIKQDESNPNEKKHYYTLDAQDFTGEYVEDVEYQGTTFNAIYKIKNGLLEGKTKYNDPATGKTIFSFKYKEGKLEE